MFSGIVEKIGIIKELTADKLVIHEPSIAQALNISDSIAVNGICLTIVDLYRENLVVEISPETMNRTNLKELNENDLLNLEKPLAYNGLIGGHLVQGHVDTTSIIKKIDFIGKSWFINFKLAKKYKNYLIQKGSITINGVSLTVSKILKDGFQIVVIPHTLKLMWV